MTSVTAPDGRRRRAPRVGLALVLLLSSAPPAAATGVDVRVVVPAGDPGAPGPTAPGGVTSPTRPDVPAAAPDAAPDAPSPDRLGPLPVTGIGAALLLLLALLLTIAGTALTTLRRQA